MTNSMLCVCVCTLVFFWDLVCRKDLISTLSKDLVAFFLQPFVSTGSLRNISDTLLHFAVFHDLYGSFERTSGNVWPHARNQLSASWCQIVALVPCYLHFRLVRF
jgi:hypothetical protein